MKTNQKNLFLLLIIFVQNLFFFFITYLNYDSMRGTDFDRYGKYLNYFVKNDIQSIGLESGVSYFYFISKFFELLSKPILISSIYVEPIYSLSIQLGNFLLFILGLLGIFYLFDYLGVDRTLNLICLSFLSIFPPVLGARLILKPEILVIAFLPWLILLYYKYFDTNKILYLLFAAPILLTLSPLKSSITFMVGLSLVILFKKDLLNKRFLIFHILLIPILGALIVENYEVNGNYIWEHVINENYLNKASFSYIFSFSISEILSNPFRNNLSGSMLSIIFADTFNDYWQRYWYHSDGWSGKNYPGNLTYIRISIFISIIFYLLSAFFIYKEKNKRFKDIATLGFVGILALIINAINLFPFLTKNFNPSKGDPMKTHLFSFLLVFTFYYFLLNVKYLKSLKIFALVFVIFNSYIFGLLNPINFSEIKEPFYLNKLHVAMPCVLSSSVESRIDFSDKWCDEGDLELSICSGEFNANITPYVKDGFLIYENDVLFDNRNLTNGNNTVTVGNFYECKSYVEGGYYSQSSEMFLNNSENEKRTIFNKLILLAGFLSILCYIFMVIFKKDLIKVN